VIDNDPSPLARRQLLTVAEKAIEQAGVVGLLPTPLHAVREAVGVKGVVDMAELPTAIKMKKPSFMKRVIGAYWYREQLIFVDRDQAPARARFVEAHELAHKLIPWQEARFQLDDVQQIVADVEMVLEAEANLTGSHLIFQGRGFLERALSFELRLDTPLAMSQSYGASMHATSRYYAEHQVDEVVFLSAGRYVRGDGSIPIFSCAASASFKERFGDLAARIPGRRLAVEGGAGKPFGDIIFECMRSNGTASKEIEIKDLNGDRVRFRADAFFNQYQVLIMCSRKRLVRAGRRVRVQAR
jgi:hypothetical protein